MENIEKLVEDLERSIPTIEDIEKKTNIKVISIKKYFPQLFRAKKAIISGAYIIFTESKDRYIGCSENVLARISQHMSPFSEIRYILVVYIYETEDIDAKCLESWLVHTLKPELNIIYPNKKLIYVKNNRPKLPQIIVDRKKIYENTRGQIYITLNTKFLKNSDLNLNLM